MRSVGWVPTNGTGIASAFAIRPSERRPSRSGEGTVPEPTTLFDKIWSAHEILVREDGATLLHVDRHLIHDGAANVFKTLDERGLSVRRPDRTFATPDHYVATTGRRDVIAEPYRRDMVD